MIESAARRLAHELVNRREAINREHTRLLWAKIKNSIDDVMKSVTLQDIVNDYERIKTNNESLKLKI